MFRATLSLSSHCAPLLHCIAYCFHSLILSLLLPPSIHRPALLPLTTSLIWFAMLYYAMQCNAMQSNAMQCNAMTCNAMLCNPMLCYAMLWHAMPCYAMPFYSIMCCVLSFATPKNRMIFPLTLFIYSYFFRTVSPLPSRTILLLFFLFFLLLLLPILLLFLPILLLFLPLLLILHLLWSSYIPTHHLFALIV